jgi:hypothetical protein
MPKPSRKQRFLGSLVANLFSLVIFDELPGPSTMRGNLIMVALIALVVAVLVILSKIVEHHAG